MQHKDLPGIFPFFKSIFVGLFVPKIPKMMIDDGHRRGCVTETPLGARNNKKLPLYWRRLGLFRFPGIWFRNGNSFKNTDA